jgi:hypothetical protein
MARLLIIVELYEKIIPDLLKVYHYFDNNILLLILVQKISLIFDLSCAEDDSKESTSLYQFE